MKQDWESYHQSWWLQRTDWTALKLPILWWNHQNWKTLQIKNTTMKAIDRIFDNLWKKTQENKVLKQENRRLKQSIKIKDSKIQILEQKIKILESEIKRFEELQYLWEF